MTTRAPRRELCRTCRSEIVWGTDASTRSLMPVDADPSPNGNISVWVDAAGAAHLVTLSRAKASATRAAGKELHLSHFASCPDAAQWRKDRRKGRS